MAFVSPTAPPDGLTALGDDEQWLWRDRPKQGLIWRQQDWFYVPVHLICIWFGLRSAWNRPLASMPLPNLLLLAGLIALGIYLLAGRFVVDTYTRRNTIYGLTSRRVLISSGLFSRDLRSLDLVSLPEMSLSLEENSYGTITFGPGAANFWFGLGRIRFGNFSIDLLSLLNSGKNSSDKNEPGQPTYTPNDNEPEPP
jgi:hypothetical protein